MPCSERAGRLKPAWLVHLSYACRSDRASDGSMDRASAPSDAVSDRSMVEMARQIEHRNDPWTERARREMQDRCMTEKVRQIGHRMDPWTDRARQVQHHLDPWIDILRARQMIMSKEWTRGHICQVRWSIGWIQGQSGHVKYRSSD